MHYADAIETVKVTTPKPSNLWAIKSNARARVCVWKRVKLCHSQKSHHRNIIIINKTILIFCHIEWASLGERAIECANSATQIDTILWKVTLEYGKCGYDICQWFITTKCNQSLSFTRIPFTLTSTIQRAVWLTKTHQSDELKSSDCFCLFPKQPHKYTNQLFFSRHFRTFIHSIHCSALSMSVYCIPWCYCTMCTTVCSLCRPFSIFSTCYCSTLLTYLCVWVNVWVSMI